jgi:hypothetical protein
MCIDDQAFRALMDEIKSQGYDETTASEYASLIGDMPIYDEQGMLLVLDMRSGTVLARLRPLKFFG